MNYLKRSKKNSKEEQVRQQAETNQKMRQDELDDRHLHFEFANLNNNWHKLLISF